MTAWTLDEIITSLAEWKKALSAASTGKAYTIGSRSFTRQDLPEIRKTIDWLEKELARKLGMSGPVFVRAVYAPGRR